MIRAAQGSAAFILHGGFMEQVTLSKKAEEEIVKAAKMAAFAAFTENSKNLMTIGDVAIYINRSYNSTANNIITRSDFPPARYLESENEQKRYVAGEIVKWGMRYMKRL